MHEFAQQTRKELAEGEFPPATLNSEGRLRLTEQKETAGRPTNTNHAPKGPW